MTQKPSLSVALLRFFKWPAAILLAIATAATVFILLFGWNWLRQPIEHYALNKTGRVLAIKGDLTLAWHWPLPRITAKDITFANPSWAGEPLMFKASSAEIELDLLKLLQGHFVFTQVHLVSAAAFLEQGSEGRQSWLLDLWQKDPDARIEIGLITLDEGLLGYDDLAQKTHIRAGISSIGSSNNPQPASSPYALAFTAEGQFKGNAFKAKGSGGSVIALRYEALPYPLKVEASFGRTHVVSEGTVTGLLKLSTLDMKLAVRGDNLDQLFPIIGIATPRTRPYAVDGRLQRAGNDWNYEDFKGRFGTSDIAGSAQLTVTGQRPMVVANLTSNVLDIDDLGPLIGARVGSVKAARRAAEGEPIEGQNNTEASAGADVAPPLPATPKRMRVLPDLPFKTERWNSLDADVNLRAKTIRRASA